LQLLVQAPAPVMVALAQVLVRLPQVLVQMLGKVGRILLVEEVAQRAMVALLVMVAIHM